MKNTHEKALNLDDNISTLEADLRVSSKNISNLEIDVDTLDDDMQKVLHMHHEQNRAIDEVKNLAPHYEQAHQSLDKKLNLLQFKISNQEKCQKN